MCRRPGMMLSHSLLRSLPYFSRSTLFGRPRLEHRKRSGSGPIGSMKSIAALAFENECRSIAELSLRRLFGALPGSMVGEHCAHNVREAVKMCESMGKSMPVRGSMRHLPKGATGLCPAKTLHDDGNSALAPGVWTGFTGCSHGGKAVLRFVFRDRIISMAALQKRLVLFHGWVPHVTEASGKVVFNSMPFQVEQGEFRSHCSSFLKPEQEFVSLVLFSPENLKKTVDGLHQAPSGSSRGS